MNFYEMRSCFITSLFQYLEDITEMLTILQVKIPEEILNKFNMFDFDFDSQPKVLLPYGDKFISFL